MSVGKYSKTWKHTILLYLYVSRLYLVGAQCAHKCSNHGICNNLGQCECHANYRGGDCSRKICPTGTAFSDSASSINSAHAAQECSGRGICNEEKGQCECMQGFTGIACERSK